MVSSIAYCSAASVVNSLPAPPRRAGGVLYRYTMGRKYKPTCGRRNGGRTPIPFIHLFKYSSYIIKWDRARKSHD